MAVNSDLLKILKLKISPFVMLFVAVLTFSACGVVEKIEVPSDEKAMDKEIEVALKTPTALTWEKANQQIRCHFIYSSLCQKFEDATNKKFNSHFNRCGIEEDLEYSKVDDGRNVLEIRNVSFAKFTAIRELSDIEKQNGLVFSGSVYFISASHTDYDTAAKTRFASENTGLPTQNNIYKVWYEEQNVKNNAGQIVKDGHWVCDICKLSKKYSQVDCKENYINDFPIYRSLKE